MAFPPNNSKEWVKLLKRLERKTKDYRIQPDFIIVPHVIYPAISAHIVKKLIFFGFSLEEVKAASH